MKMVKTEAKHYMASHDYSDAVITFTATNRKQALKRLIELTESKGTAWFLEDVSA